MADDAHEAGGCATVLDGVAHRFTVQGQRALPGGELGISVLQRALEVRLAQKLARLLVLRAQEDLLRRCGGLGVSALAASIPARIPDIGLQHWDRMAEHLEPIPSQSSLAQRQRARGEVRAVPGGQNAKPRTVGRQVQPRALLPIAPPIPMRRRNSSAAPPRNIPERLANLRQPPQGVLRLHQGLKARLLATLNPPHLDLYSAQLPPCTSSAG